MSIKKLSIGRLKLMNRPAKVADLDKQEIEQFEDKWLLKAEKIETKQLRAWRHILSSS